MIKTNIDITTLSEYHAREFRQAENLLHDMEALGWTLCQIVLEDGTLMAIFEDKGKLFRIKKDYSGNIQIFSHPYVYGSAENLSNSARTQIRIKHKTNNMKVMSAKKIQREIDAVNAMEAEIAEADSAAKKKTNVFLETIKDMPVIMAMDGKSGYIKKNGMKFSFELGTDGYVSQKIDIHYTVDASIEAFKALADNKYTEKN